MQEVLFRFDVDERGYLKKRESSDLEYKENFHRGDEVLKYIKTLVGMANNKGGKIIFGIKNSPHVPIGMTNNKFMELDPKDFDNQIRQCFSPAIDWSTQSITYDSKTYGVILVKEAENKPVICCKSKSSVLREGAIYFRYRGETKEIGYTELHKLIEAEKEKERILWMSHIQKMAMIGPANVALCDVYKGEITMNDRKVLIDKDLVKKIKFIREGHFVESDDIGSPALKLLGDAEAIDLNEVPAINPNDIYVYTTAQLQEQLHLNQYEMQAVIFTLKIKEKKKWHLDIQNGKSVVHKYTNVLLQVLKRKMTASDFLPKCILGYNEYRKELRNAKKNKKKRI